MKNKLAAIAILVLLSSTSAFAAPILVGSFSNVQVGSNAYDVSFFQNNSGFTTYHDVFGTDPHSFVPANPSDALALATAVLAIGKATNFNFSPFQSGLNGFLIPYAVGEPLFSYVTGFIEPFDNVFGPFLIQTDDIHLGVSFAVVSAVSVAEPSTAFLFGIAAFGVLLLRFRRRGRSVLGTRICWSD